MWLQSVSRRSELRLHGMEQIAALQMQLLAKTESRPLVDQAAKELLSPHAAELAFNILFCLADRT